MSAHAEPETLTTEILPPASPYRLYLQDAALSHLADSRLVIVDGDRMRVLSVFATGGMGLTTLSPDRSEIYIATQYYSKLNRGERLDQVEVIDALTLKRKAEIPVPPKHAQSLPYRDLLHTTSDGHFVLVQNATPATSVSVVDVRARTFVGEIPTPGCWSIAPSVSTPNRFSTLCGDGTLLTITLDSEGKPASRQKSEKFFDPDKDPVFISSANVGDQYYFVSYHGVVHPVNLGGEVATFGEPWDLVAASSDTKDGWRPGGYHPMALHPESGSLYVAMHPKGRNGTQKSPAKEIWVYDLQSRKRIKRLPGYNAMALAVSRGDQPRLFVLDGAKAGVVSLDPNGSGKPLGRMDGLVEVPVSLGVQ
jgi:methylamine dehydrogenase heavy chain